MYNYYARFEQRSLVGNNSEYFPINLETFIFTIDIYGLLLIKLYL